MKNVLSDVAVYSYDELLSAIKVFQELEKLGGKIDLQLLKSIKDDLELEGLPKQEMSMEDIISRSAYKKGGVMKKRMRFQDKVDAISERLEGTKVPARLRKDYGARYNREESEMAARRIVGSMMKKYEK
jgi:hypothetical protein